MNTFRNIIFLIPIVLFSCNEHKSELLEKQGLLGEWQVYESGYSPGGDYVIDEVPNDPLKYVRFGEDHLFESNYEGLENVNYFDVIEENQKPVLLLYENNPGDEHQNRSELVYKYYAKIEGDKLKLMYAYCIEGCHIGLKRLE